MGKRETSKQVWISDGIVVSLQKRKDAEGFIGSMNAYIENVLNKYGEGKLQETAGIENLLGKAGDWQADFTADITTHQK